MIKNMDALHLVDLRLSCRLGIEQAERRRPQSLLANIALYGDWHCAGTLDCLDESVDYAALAQALRSELGRGTFKLLEAVAEAAAEICLRNSCVTAVEVRVRKRPPKTVEGLRCFDVCVLRKRPLKKTRRRASALKKTRG